MSIKQLIFVRHFSEHLTDCMLRRRIFYFITVCVYITFRFHIFDGQTVNQVSLYGAVSLSSFLPYFFLFGISIFDLLVDIWNIINVSLIRHI